MAGFRVSSDKFQWCLNLSLRTQEEYSRDLEDLAGFLRRQSINDWAAVTLPHLEAFLAHLERRGLKPSTWFPLLCLHRTPGC